MVTCFLSCTKNRPTILFGKLLAEKLKYRETIGISNGKITARKYRGKKKYVYFLSNIFKLPNQQVSSKHRYRFLEFYNKHRGHVDQADRSISDFRWMHKNYKWTQAAFIGLIEIAIYNAWIIFKTLNSSKTTMKQFCVKLVAQITKKYGHFKKQYNEIQSSNHHLVWDHLFDGKRRCKGVNTADHRTNYYCLECQKPVCKKCFMAAVKANKPC